MEKVIPRGQYVYKGVDFGKEISDHLEQMIEGQFIQVIANDLPSLANTRAYICSEPGTISWYENIAEVNVSNKAYLRIGRDISQICTWNGSGGQPDW